MPHPDVMLRDLGGHPDDAFPRVLELTFSPQLSSTSSVRMIIDEAVGADPRTVHEVSLEEVEV